jgi:N-acetylglucosaminyldiphosphoundecaprenol N-acetyl-beta-D-mannosaminyltransferase
MSTTASWSPPMVTPVAPARDTIDVLGCRIDRLDMEQAVERCVAAIETRSFLQHLAINAAKIVALHRDEELRRATEACDFVTADGQSVVWASRLLGSPVPERVAGIDLMLRMTDVAAERGYRVFILGAKQEVLERGVRALRHGAPELKLAGYRNGFFGEEELPEVVQEIRDARADMLFVAISSPFKEYFLGTHGPSLGVPFVMGVGGAIDVVAGTTQRAPEAWQRAGLEWLYRLKQEPRRMFKRYAVTNTLFLALLARALMRRRHVLRLASLRSEP